MCCRDDPPAEGTLQLFYLVTSIFNNIIQTIFVA